MRKMKYKLKDIFDLQMGKTPSRDNVDYWNTNDYKWISIGDLSTTEMYISNTKEHLSEKAVQESRIKLIPRNTVVMSFKLSIGKTAITAEDMYSNEAIMAFHDKHVVDMLPKYIFYLFKYRDWDKGSNKAVMGKTLNKATLSEIEIELCSLEKQKEIVKVLDKITGSLAGRKSELLLLDDLIKARFVEMFGSIKEERLLGDISEFVTVGIANSATHAYAESGIPMLRNQNIKENYLDDTDIIYIKSEFATQYESKKLKENDIIVMRTGYPGVACLVPKKYEGCQTFTTLIVRLKEDNNSSYVCSYINSDFGKKFIDSEKVGVAQQNVGAKSLAKMPIKIPPIELQNQFAAFVAEVDKSKVAVQKALDETQTLFDSLMQEYFG